ncbi:hypothetical protein [Magnetospirillum sp. 15-1]|uniref:hypothetical protein n=1 Tax=Magnetospirillum sp. 15-1 TaxID=1979370 RepID=UPI000BBB7BCB|nr:hypothetical protein [Magnetospirillum sp. 15-1]
MTAEPETPAPIFAFHEAQFSVADQLWPMIALAVFGALFVLLPIKEVALKGPPETALVVVWLSNGGMIWFLGRGLLGTWLSMRRGEKAGLRVAEGEDYLEVAFFAGPRPCRVQRFAYAEITGCGVDTFFDAFGNPRTRPYVATRGLLGGSSKTMIPLAAPCDARQVSSFQGHHIAVDLDRVIRRHCDLPQPEIPLAVVAEEHDQELLRFAAQQFQRIETEQALRRSRFLGVDWVRLGMAALATALLCVLWLDDEIHLRWDDGSDWLVVGIVFYVFHRLTGSFLKAWRERPRDE